MKKLYFIEQNCIGCKRCMVGCITEHSRSKNPVIAYKYEKYRQTSRIMVEEEGELSFPFACRHCEDPDCVKACVSGAMYKDESGEVCYDPKKCVGCYSCIMACSFGAILKDINNKDRKQIVKCDLCPGRIEGPACVEICPNRAVVYEERGDKK